MLPEHPIDECGNKINPRAIKTILRQFVDSGAIPFEERAHMEAQGLIELNSDHLQLTPAGKAVLCGWSDVNTSQIKEVQPDMLQRTLNQHMRNLIDASQQAAEELTAVPKTTLETQVGGDHYKKLGQYQPWQVCAACMTPAELRGYMKGTVIAYLMREQDKGGDLDIKKAAHTIQLWEEVRKDK